MDAWAAEMGLVSGRVLFETVFQRLGVAHEMGHWQQHLSRRFLSLDKWDTELEANRIAIAFWSGDPREQGALPQTVNGWIAIYGKAP